MPDGCTIGALNMDEKRYLFKNRDLVYPDFKDTTKFDDEAFLVTGVNIAVGKPTGASIGINKHGVMMASSTVLISQDPPYDDLLQLLLREAKSLSEAVSIVRDDLDSGSKYQWCNFVISDSKKVGIIEIGNGEMVTESDVRMAVRTNHHLKLPTSKLLESAPPEMREAAGSLTTSRYRLQVAFAMLEDAKVLTDITQMLSSHSEGRGFDSICRHYHPNENRYRGMTSYSYILESLESEDSPEYRIHVVRGNPCESAYQTLEIDFAGTPAEKDRLVSGFP
ncbi:hypothetical protein EU537_10675 [Candidatus Thorarchaeota archaeon]|nr:MAG: hypothetical protein EU537_10675 [Candidatus Thorarchaeota archaeon]